MNELLLFVYTEFKLIEELGNKDKKKKKKDFILFFSNNLFWNTVGFCGLRDGALYFLL